MAGKSGISLNKTVPIIVIKTIPTPDQMAQANPTGIVLITKLRKYKAHSNK